MTDLFSMRYYGLLEAVMLGWTCQNVLALVKQYTSVFVNVAMTSPYLLSLSTLIQKQLMKF